MTHEFEHPTKVVVMDQEGESVTPTPNIDAFRAANLRVVDLMLRGFDPHGTKVDEANTYAEDVLAGRVSY